MKIASHSILSNATATARYQFPPYIFLFEAEQTFQHIDGLTGLSSELLHIIQNCNTLVFCEDSSERLTQANHLIKCLRNLRQVCLNHEVDSKEALKVVLSTAESYRLATILCIHCRILRYLQFNPLNICT